MKTIMNYDFYSSNIDGTEERFEGETKREGSELANLKKVFGTDYKTAYNKMTSEKAEIIPWTNGRKYWAEESI
jgi:hypothetical protein